MKRAKGGNMLHKLVLVNVPNAVPYRTVQYSTVPDEGMRMALELF